MRVSPIDWRAARNRPFAEFLRPARRGGRALWRLLFGVVALVLFLTFSVVLIARSGIAQGGFSSPAFLYAALLSIAAAWPAMALIMPALHGRRIWTLLGPNARDVWRGMRAGVLAVLASVVALTFIAIMDGSIHDLTFQPPRPDWAWLALIAVILIALQASAEELVFRGYLQQQLAARCRSFWVWAVAPSLLFGFLHYAPEGDAPADIADAAAYFVASTQFGLLAAYLTWRTGNLGAAIGLHVANNVLAILVVDSVGDELGVLALYNAPLPAPTDLVIGEAIFVAVLLFLFEWRRSPIRRIVDTPPLFGRGQALVTCA